ncbi:NnrU family protein [Kaarinaea lacus]
MLAMIAGLLLFLGTHSVRIFAEDWRNRQISQRGENTWMGLYSVIALTGFVLIVWGYGQARLAPDIIWQPPLWTKHLAAVLTLPSFILLAAAYVPGTKIKTIVGHPMILSVKLWAIAHLLANGNLADIILFGAFLLWAILDFRTSRHRDKAAGTRYQSIGISRDIIAVVVGVIAWVAFSAVLHNWLIGVKPFG